MLTTSKQPLTDFFQMYISGVHTVNRLYSLGFQEFSSLEVDDPNTLARSYLRINDRQNSFLLEKGWISECWTVRLKSRDTQVSLMQIDSSGLDKNELFMSLMPLDNKLCTVISNGRNLRTKYDFMWQNNLGHLGVWSFAFIRPSKYIFLLA